MSNSTSAAVDRPDLEAIGAKLVRALKGSWHRSGGMCRCPAHADRSPSLSIRVGKTALLFHCFAGCDSRDIIRALLDIDPDALEHGISSQDVPDRDDNGWMLSRIRDLWGHARSITGTPADRYLRGRAIGRDSPALRYHAHTPLGPKGAVRFRPAMLAAVHEGPRLVALERSFLDADLGRRSRDLRKPRRMLGQPGRGCVRLARAQDILGLAEGVESAFSAMILLGIPVWATLGSERFGRVDIPQRIQHLILLADNDPAGHLAIEAASEAHAAGGRSIDVEWPWGGLNDWNDVLRKGGKRVGG